MNFLNPLFLIALSAVAVPIIIHMFSRRRVPVIPFSTLRFLRRSDRRSMRRINFRRLLLLLLRVAGVALVALAFARPVLRGGIAALFPVTGSKAVCIMLDRSYSMGVEEDEGLLFDRAKSILADILDNIDERDEITVLLADRGCEVVYDGDRVECEVIGGALKDIGPSWRGTDLRGAVEEGMKVLGESRCEARELFIISDFQRSAIRGKRGARAGGRTDAGRGEPGRDRAGAVQRGDETEAAGEEARKRVRTFLAPVQPEPGANVAIERVVTPRVALHKGEIAGIKVFLKNTSVDLKARFPLSVLIDGRRIVEKEIEIIQGGVREVSVEFPAERTGWVKGEVRKKKDRLQADDRRYFTLHVREKVNVLLVADESGFYLEQALSPEGSEGDISLVRRGWRSFTTADLEKAEALVLGPGRGPLDRDIELFNRFLRSGGKILVLVTAELGPAVREMSRYSPVVEFRGVGDGFVTIAAPRAAPDFLSPFEEGDIQALSRLRFRGAPVVRGVSDKAVLLRFRDGSPFMWEEARGEGVAVFMAADPGPRAGDLALSPYFLPLIQQALLAVGPDLPTGEGRLIGDPIVWEGSFGGEYVCRLPGGERLRPGGGGLMDRARRPEREAVGGFDYKSEPAGRTGRDDAGDIRGAGREGIVIPPVDEPGFVTILRGPEIEGLVAVNPDCGKESDLSCMQGGEAADSLGLEYYMVIDDRAELASSIYHGREGREISMPLLIAALAVFAIELFVAQTTKGEAGE